MKIARVVVVLLLAFSLVPLTATPSPAVLTITVNSTGDESLLLPVPPVPPNLCITAVLTCTLRAAIELSNLIPTLDPLLTPDTINFNIPDADPGCSGGVCTINPVIALPQITDPVTIDASLSATNNDIIELDGTGTLPPDPLIPGDTLPPLTGFDPVADGLEISGAGPTIPAVVVNAAPGIEVTPPINLGLTGGGGTEIRGLVINNFEGAGIRVNPTEGLLLGIPPDDVVIADNFIGTDATGTVDEGNGESGVVVTAGASHQIIGNLISGNLTQGVDINGGVDPDPGTTGNFVQGNTIGTDVTGAFAIPNGLNGVQVTGNSNSNTIGGAAPGEGNLISGNGGHGVSLSNQSNLNVVQGNLIGTTADGTAALGNDFAGVGIFDSPANTIGGSAAGAGNVISGNGTSGVEIEVAGGNLVEGNLIGTNDTGDGAIGNFSAGVFVGDAPNNAILSNVISATVDGPGVGIDNSSDNVVQGNLIGTDAAGTAPLPNVGDGVFIAGITGPSTGNLIGGTDPGAGNVIFFNAAGGNGVAIVGDGSVGNAILRNSIDLNTGLGIDLGQDGVTLNDLDDPDSGPNNLQNFPVITSATSGSTTITGTLNSTPDTQFRLEFFSSPVCDGSDHGEGANFLGAENVTTDANGDVGFNVTFTDTVPVGQVITSTATQLSGAGDPIETSEFSACQPVTPTPVTQLDVEPETDTNVVGTQHTLTATVSLNGTFVAGANVDFEIESGPNANLNGNAATADLECDTALVTGQCTVNYTGGPNAGTDTIRAWIDANGDDAVPGEADTAEGRDEGTTPGAAEPDQTDVVEKTWVLPCPPQQQCLDVEPEFDQNPVNTQHTLTATVFSSTGPVQGANVDFEIESGPNANLNGNAATADLECDTDAQGQCTVNYTGGPTAGQDFIRAWIDANGDDAVPGEADTAEAILDNDADNTDVVSKSFQLDCPTGATPVPLTNGGPPPPQCLDVEPETDSNPTGTQHTLTATVITFQGPVQGANVDFEVTAGPNANLNANAATADLECDTDAQGQCTVNYTGGPNAGTDTIRAWIDANGDDAVPGEADVAEGRDEGTTPGTVAEPDVTDVVEKTFTLACPAQQQCLDVEPEADANPTGTQHTLTATVITSGGPVQGANVDFEVTAGPNANLNGNAATADRECDTNAQGTCTVNYTGGPNAGTDTIRGWIDANGDDAVPGEADTAEGQNEGTTPGTVAEPDVTDVVEKTFTTLKIDCEPETATHGVGAQATITCTVTDAQNAPVPSQPVDGELLAGSANSADGTTAPPDFSGTTNAQGQVVFNYTGNNPGNDTGCFWVDENNDGTVPGEGDCGEVLADPPDDDTDVVTRTWAAAGPQTCPAFPNATGNHILGTNNDDIIIGTPQRDIICLFDGNDVGRGLGGNDIIDGGRDDDELFGGDGNDLLLGRSGNDVVNGNAGDDKIRDSGAGDDLLRGQDGNDLLVGNSGSDILIGGAGRDTERGNRGPDTLRGNSGADIVAGGPGTDRVLGNADADTLRGGDDNDDLFGGPANDRLNGGGGTDVCTGGPGIDQPQVTCEVVNP